MSDLLHESPPLPAADRRLVELYMHLGRPSDDLPYSPAFEELFLALRKAGDARSEADVLQRLFRLRKAARLPRASVPSAPLTGIHAGDIDVAKDLVQQALGSLGSRDRLPYSDTFERLYAEYIARASRPLSRHDFWRLVARVSK